MYVYFLRSRIASLTDRILKVSFRFLAVSGATLEKKEKAIQKKKKLKKSSVGATVIERRPILSVNFFGFQM